MEICQSGSDRARTHARNRYSITILNILFYVSSFIRINECAFDFLVNYELTTKNKFDVC